MKVLHITRQDTGGAGLCAYRICKSLQSSDVDCKMLVLDKSRSDEFICAPFVVWNKFYRIIHRLLRILNIYIFEYDILTKQTIESKASFTSPVRNINILNHPWVKEADIIHLHQVDNFFNQPDFLKKINKPVVWTIHDENFFYGTAHYHDCVYENDELEKKYRKIKIDMVANKKNIGIVLLSNYFMQRFGTDPILKGKQVRVINNSVDCSKFIAYDKKIARTKLGLNNIDIFLVFVAANISDPFKGLQNLINAVKEINIEEIKILAIGDNSSFVKNSIVLDVGKIYDIYKLSLYLSASDYFVMPSLQEAFSQAPLEAMACGKAAIVTPVSGVEEIINDNNGVICGGFSKYDLMEGIKIAMTKKYDSQLIRADIESRFSPERISAQYLSFYKSMLQCQAK